MLDKPKRRPVAKGGAPKLDDLLAGLIGFQNSHTRTGRQVVAELHGDRTCSAHGIVATAYTPVLALCRQLLAQGVDPDTAVNVFRGATLALRVRSIREAARLTVKTAGNGTPIFALDDGQEGAAAPPIRLGGAP